MIRAKANRRASLMPLVISHLVLVTLSQSNIIESFSISSPPSSLNQNMKNNPSSVTNQSKNQQLSTTLNPIITTLSQQGNEINSPVKGQPLTSSSSNKYLPQSTNELEPKHNSEARSNNEDHDETVPLATINNHSKNNQPQMKPPQYVDVSNLVSRNSNTSAGHPSSSSSSISPLPSSSSLSSSSLTSGLTAKSRSGLPECATQQVCNAIFVRMNYTQKLCECSSNYNWRCSSNLDPLDGHTIELTRKFDKRIYTQIKTCEPLREVRACKSPTDWTLLALQSERSGKAHYVVVCKCPTWAQLEGPYTHNHPPYANIPGIRVYGMLCAHQTARSSSAQTYATYNPALNIYPEFPWPEALNVLNTTNLLTTTTNLNSVHY